MQNPNLELLKLLVNAKMDCNIKNQAGLAPLHIAALHKDTKKLKILLNATKVDLDIVGKNGCTPLHFAAIHNHIKTIQILLDNGANPNIRNEE